jgi:hypothetical protein
MVTRLLVIAVAVVGCKWTDFDDLSDQTWAKSTTPPNGDSNDYGVAVQRGVRSATTGGTLVVLGNGSSTYSELTYDANGNSKLAPTEVKLESAFGVSSFPDQPVLLADPDSDDVSIAVPSGSNSIAVLTGSHMLSVQQIFGPNAPDGATYVKFDAAMGARPLVGAGPKVFGVASDASMMHECTLTDETTQQIAIAALGAAKRTSADTTETVVVWTKAGKLLLYAPTVWNGTVAGCTGSQSLAAGADTGFMPGTGAQIFTVKDATGGDTSFVVIAGRAAGSGGINNQGARIAVYNISTATPTLVGSPLDKDGLHGMALASFDSGATTVFAAGYPTAPTGGTNGGIVEIYPVSTSTGISASPKMTLADAQPDNGESFGRGVTAMPFNGKTALVVAANNEIFAYVELDPIYGNLRP